MTCLSKSWCCFFETKALNFIVGLKVLKHVILLEKDDYNVLNKIERINIYKLLIKLIRFCISWLKIEKECDNIYKAFQQRYEAI